MVIPITDLVPVDSPCFGKRELEYLMDCLESGWISSGGSYVSRFEAAFAERLGRRFAVAVCNGTAALQVAVDALGLGPGDEVILPSFTIISCVLAILRAGATPVVVDAEPDTWNMAVSQVEARITPRTKAVMAVHIYGLPTDMQPLLALTARYGLQVIEDAAQGLGIVCGGRPCGSFGTISTLSFYPNKLVTTGEGGMVLTDDTDVAQRCRSLRNLCFRSDRRFVHDALGWNFRMTALQAAVGLAQLENYESKLQRKRELGLFYTGALKSLSHVRLPPARSGTTENVYWVFGLVLEDHVPMDAVEVMRRLRLQGIETRPFFWPLHEQPVLLARGLFNGERLPVSERLARRGFYIPSGVGLSQEQRVRVVDALHRVLK